jgi:hypothetical protein
MNKAVKGWLANAVSDSFSAISNMDFRCRNNY